MVEVSQFTPEQMELLKKLNDKHWRMTSWVIYKIKKKNGIIVPFIPNKHQRKFIEAKAKYRKNIIPKARQLWISTVEDIWIFDEVLFNRNVSAGIIADTKPIATLIFKDKIKVLRDNLPEWMRYKNWVKWSGKDKANERRQVNTDTVNELSFDNTWSSISVGTSFRWGTLQYLHVSEYGKICSKFPAKAEEIKSWAFETLWALWYNTIESTAMGASGDFYEMCKDAKYIQDQWKTPTSMEFNLLFFPWWEETSYRSNDEIIFNQDEIEYFNQLRDKWIYLDRMQMTWYALKKRVQKDKIYREYPSTFEEAFLLVTAWSYYENELNQARLQKRICRVPYDNNLPVHTAWDLWWAWWWDDTSIWFFQIYGREIRVIDYWEWNKMSLIAIREKIVKTKPYEYWKHFWPHDMMVTEYAEWKTRRQTAYEQWLEFEVLEKLPIKDWIEMVRWIFPKCFFDEEKTKAGVNHLSLYTRKPNEKYGWFTDEIAKNWSQHAADAFRYMATAILDIIVEDKESFLIQPDYKI